MPNVLKPSGKEIHEKTREFQKWCAAALYSHARFWCVVVLAEIHLVHRKGDGHFSHALTVIFFIWSSLMRSFDRRVSHLHLTLHTKKTKHIPVFHIFLHVIHYDPVTYSPAYKHIFYKQSYTFTFSFYIFKLLLHILGHPVFQILS